MHKNNVKNDLGLQFADTDELLTGKDVDKEITRLQNIQRPAWKYVFLFYKAIDTKKGIKYMRLWPEEDMRKVAEKYNLAQKSHDYYAAKKDSDFQKQSKIWEEVYMYVTKYKEEVLTRSNF
ncbi:MAG: hypothetical protein LRY41_03030 [Candidatus Pacebacteria bacterium]|nr:hypothetical protein [Candidatus Paceibacterota bacterium]MCD8528271.1 hypothetical protein [Candidatus Paceibacterota bacterium]MCD8563960.1 hypothetical protein [Candidatus Paceibacterota bacterium]